MVECPQDELVRVAALIDRDEEAGLLALETLIGSYGQDARLYFLLGSVLAGGRRYKEARKAMGEAVRIAPNYALARFQLGFLEFSDGDPGSALGTWKPLKDLPADHALRLFAAGLEQLAQDELMQSVETLRRGIAANTENAPLNHDMQLI